MTATTSATVPRARFADLPAAEWIKLWSLRSTYGWLIAGALLAIGICVHRARSNMDLVARGGTEASALDPMNAAFASEAFQFIMIIAASVGALTVAGEYGTGLIRVTFTAVPARRSLVAAKAVVVTAVMLVFGALVAATSFGVTQAIYHREHIGLSITDPGAFRAVAASALLAPVCALIGMAFGALVRHVAGAIVTLVGVLILLPALFTGETYRWVKEIGNAMPYSAWEKLTTNPVRPAHIPSGPEKYPLTITEAWIVLAAWSVAAVVTAVLVVHHRDV
jgi:ABC-2 type transport system permease protein